MGKRYNRREHARRVRFLRRLQGPSRTSKPSPCLVAYCEGVLEREIERARRARSAVGDSSPP